MISIKPEAYDFSQQMYPKTTFVGFEKRGYASRGCRIHTETDGELFILLGPLDTYKDQRIGLSLPHCPTIHSVIPQQGSERVYTTMDATRFQARPLLNILHQVGGLHTVQTEDGVSGKNGVNEKDLQRTYQRVVDALTDLHSVDVGNTHMRVFNSDLDTQTRNLLYRKALENIITDSQRLDGVAGFFFSTNRATELTYAKYNQLRAAMIRLAEKQHEQSHNLKVVHGDAWAANIFASDIHTNKPTIEFIDPAILFSDPAIDVVFSLFDIAAIYAHSGKDDQVKYLHIADELVDKYITQTGDTTLRKRMAIFYGYKSFVSAVFDIPDNEERRMATFNAGLGAVLESDEFGNDFYFSKFSDYAEKGATCK